MSNKCLSLSFHAIGWGQVNLWNRLVHSFTRKFLSFPSFYSSAFYCVFIFYFLNSIVCNYELTIYSKEYHDELVTY